MKVSVNVGPFFLFGGCGCGSNERWMDGVCFMLGQIFCNKVKFLCWFLFKVI